MSDLVAKALVELAWALFRDAPSGIKAVAWVSLLAVTIFLGWEARKQQQTLAKIAYVVALLAVFGLVASAGLRKPEEVRLRALVASEGASEVEHAFRARK